MQLPSLTQLDLRLLFCSPHWSPVLRFVLCSFSFPLKPSFKWIRDQFALFINSCSRRVHHRVLVLKRLMSSKDQNTRESTVKRQISTMKWQESDCSKVLYSSGTRRIANTYIKILKNGVVFYPFLVTLSVMQRSGNKSVPVITATLCFSHQPHFPAFPYQKTLRYIYGIWKTSFSRATYIYFISTTK